MIVTYIPLESKSGFKSPGFTISPTGALVANGIDTTNGLSFNGLQVLNTTTIGSTVLNSSLQTLGTLTGLTVNSTGAVSVTAASVTVSSSGVLSLTSGAVGTINNVNIGGTTPGDGTFNTLTATNNIIIGNLSVKSLAIAMSIALQ